MFTYASQFRERVLPLAARGQQQLRAVGGGGFAGHDETRERAMEEAARGICRAAHGSFHRRSAARLYGAAQSSVPRLERVIVRRQRRSVRKYVRWPRQYGRSQPQYLISVELYVKMGKLRVDTIRQFRDCVVTYSIGPATV